jgi:hypothetical protein
MPTQGLTTFNGIADYAVELAPKTTVNLTQNATAKIEDGAEHTTMSTVPMTNQLFTGEAPGWTPELATTGSLNGLFHHGLGLDYLLLKLIRSGLAGRRLGLNSLVRDAQDGANLGDGTAELAAYILKVPILTVRQLIDLGPELLGQQGEYLPMQTAKEIHENLGDSEQGRSGLTAMRSRIVENLATRPRFRLTRLVSPVLAASMSAALGVDVPLAVGDQVHPASHKLCAASAAYLAL